MDKHNIIMTTSFEALGLRTEILEAIKDLGFEHPTEVQEQSIPFLLSSDSDVITLAQTGTGKTAAFGLPILEQIDESNPKPQALILSPTRELCVQIAKDIESFSTKMPKINVTAVYGGASMDAQRQSLRKGSQIVAGTPGRMCDLIRRNAIDIRNIKWLVLDEADEMLSMGFKEELETILAETPKERNTYLFSATMPDGVKSISANYMRNPHTIQIGKKNTGAENVDHLYYMVNARDKYAALKRIADINPNVYGIVFCRTRAETKTIADKLMEDGYNADALHGDLSQAQRELVMHKFRSKFIQLLVATDVAARGLDVDNLSHIIHYTIPDDYEVYIHRSGRTGRAGKKGTSISIIHSREKGKLKQIAATIKKEFTYTPVPNGKQICEKQLFAMIDKMEHVEVEEDQIEGFLPVIYQKLEDLSREELIKKFVSLEFNSFLRYYENAPDLNIDPKGRSSERQGRDRGERGDRANRGDRRERGERGERSSRERRDSAAFSRLFINKGKKDGLMPKDVIGLVNDSLRSRDAKIGHIELLKNFSFFEIEKEYTDELLKSMRDKDFNGSKVAIEVSNPMPEKKNKRKKKEWSRDGGRKSFGQDRNKGKRKKF